MGNEESLLELVNYFQEVNGGDSKIKTNSSERLKRIKFLLEDFEYLGNETEIKNSVKFLIRTIDLVESKFIVAKIPARNSLLLWFRFLNLLIGFIKRPEKKLTKLFFTDNLMASELEKLRPQIKTLIGNITLVFRLAFRIKGICPKEFIETQEPKPMWNKILTNKMDIIRLVQFDFVAKEASKEA